MDQGLGISERIFKYSTYQVSELNEIEAILKAIEEERWSENFIFYLISKLMGSKLWVGATGSTSK